MRQVDLVEATGLTKATLHRILAGLAQYDLITYDDREHRYFIGPKIHAWSSAGKLKSSVVEKLRPHLEKICEELGDTIYLTLKHGNRATYVDRCMGSYPLQGLPREIGEQRPLGIGAGPLAILAALDGEAFDATIAEVLPDLQSYGMRESKLKELVVRAHSLGFALHTGEIQEGMVALGLPLRKGPSIFGAISVAGTSERLPEDRRVEVADTIRRIVKNSGIDLDCSLSKVGHGTKD
jgi:DNA-binding IclR family transcriptional regulator